MAAPMPLLAPVTIATRDTNVFHPVIFLSIGPAAGKGKGFCCRRPKCSPKGVLDRRCHAR
jgi:hypothetical protein